KSLKHIDFYYVDDDLLYLSYFRKTFNFDLPHSLFTFSSGEALINKFSRDISNSNFKIVILDYVLSSVDKKARTGIELLPIIKEIDPETEVIILSEYENMDVKATSSNLHPSTYIRKNDHTFIRLYSAINLIISKYNLKRKKRAGRISIYILLSFVILTLILFVIYWLIN
ncbi:MAG: response regulator, partial [Bacteroidales bacterium]|nr:response regulator [Bacteroidales bacterium]